MKSRADLAAELDRLVASHYYSEASEIRGAVLVWEQQLEDREKLLLRELLLDRLASDPSLVEVVLVSAWHIPEAVPHLVKILQREQRTSQLSLFTMHVLHQYEGGEVYEAIERFLDSDQESEVLTWLSRQDYARTIPYLQRALRKSSMVNACLHAFYERRKRIGFERFMTEFKEHFINGSKEQRVCLRQVLSSKQGEYNPFVEKELGLMLSLINLRG